MSNEETKKQVGGAERQSSSSSENDRDRIEQSQGQGPGGGAVGVGVFGDDSEVFRFGFVLGKITAQLIANAERRLGEMQECVAWYQREVDNCQQELESLRSLASELPESE